MSIRVDISTLQSIQDLVVRLESEPEITLVNGDKLVAKVTSLDTAHVPPDGRQADSLKGNIWISEKFDDILPDEYWKRRKL